MNKIKTFFSKIFAIFSKIFVVFNKDFILNFIAKQKKKLLLLGALFAGFLVILFFVNLYQKYAQEKYSALFHQALIFEEKGEIVKAKEELQKIHETSFAPSGVKGLASMRYAAILFAQNNVDEALKVYEEIGNSNRYNQYLRELSSLLATKILVIKANENSDEAFKKQALKQIEKFEARSKNLNLYIAEQKGIFFLKTKNLEKSFETFEAIIKNQNAEQALKLRAADMIKILVSEGYVLKNK